MRQVICSQFQYFCHRAELARERHRRSDLCRRVTCVLPRLCLFLRLPYANDNQALSAVEVVSKGFARWHPFLAELTENKPDKRRSTRELMQNAVMIDGIPVQVEELTGKPGDAILCHPAMLHTVSKNCSQIPRIMRRTNFRRKRQILPIQS